MTTRICKLCFKNIESDDKIGYIDYEPFHQRCLDELEEYHKRQKELTKT
jgi:hypothetical protein